MVAYQTYAHLLIAKGHGHPLWQPDPGEYAPVELGDVGYFQGGAFVKLFNASKDVHSWSNRLGLPEGHTPLQVGDIVCKTPLPKAPGYISSEGVLGKAIDLNAMTGASGKAGRGFNFESSKQNGALLMMRDVAYRQDAVNKKPFYDYIITHHRSWLDFAHASGRDLSQSDLILVDGCDRTSEWACATWSGENPIKFNFVVGAPGIANESAGLWGRWISSQPLDKNIGPRPLGPSAGAASPLVPPPPFNQCVFLRGFQIGDRTTFFKRQKKCVDLGSGIQVVTKRPALNSRVGSDSTIHSESQQQLASLSGAGSPSAPYLPSLQSIDFNGFPRPQDNDADGEIEENTPTAAMIGYIFSISIAQFALIHNDDLVDLLQASSGASIRDYNSWIRELAPSVYLHENVGMFSGTYNLRTSSGKAEIHPTQHTRAERSYDQSTNTNSVMLSKNPPITRQLEKTLAQDDALDTIRHRSADSVSAQHETADIQYEREVLKRNRGSENKRVKTDTPNVLNHPQTASILAQHEAANIEYEREILRRNMDVKANKPHVFGRGGVGNISESRAKISSKPFKRPFSFKGGGAAISSLSSPNDILDVDEDRRKYAQIEDSGTTQPLSYDTESSGNKASANSASTRTTLSRNSAVSESSGSPISPSREKHAVSTMWKKIVRSNSQSSPRPGYDKHRNPLVRADVYTPSLPGFDHKAGSLDDPSISPVSSTDLAFTL